MNNYPICPYEDKTDCFARRTVVGVVKECHVLRDTEFGDRECPYYKSYIQVLKEKYIKKEGRSWKE